MRLLSLSLAATTLSTSLVAAGPSAYSRDAIVARLADLHVTSCQ